MSFGSSLMIGSGPLANVFKNGLSYPVLALNASVKLSVRCSRKALATSWFGENLVMP